MQNPVIAQKAFEQVITRIAARRVCQFTISGSFNKYLYDIAKIFKELARRVPNGTRFFLLSPKSFEIEADDPFLRLRGDVGTTLAEIECNHLRAIANSDFLFVVNPKDYIGNATALEMGYAIASEIPIFVLNAILRAFFHQHYSIPCQLPIPLPGFHSLSEGAPTRQFTSPEPLSLPSSTRATIERIPSHPSKPSS